MPWMTLPRIGMHMDAHNNHPPSTPHATAAWHGGMGGAQAGRGEMHPFFHRAPPLLFLPSSPLFPIFLFSLVSGCAPSTTLLPSPASSPLVSSPCLVFPQSCCSVRHCIIVILTTHSHNVLLPPSSLLFPTPNTPAGCTWMRGLAHMESRDAGST